MNVFRRKVREWSSFDDGDDSDAWSSSADDDSSGRSSSDRSSSSDDSSDSSDEESRISSSIAPIPGWTPRMRRRAIGSVAQSSANDPEVDDKDARSDEKTRRRPLYGPMMRKCCLLLGVFSTYMLCFCFLMWVTVFLMAYGLGIYNGDSHGTRHGGRHHRGPADTSLSGQLAEMWQDIQAPVKRRRPRRKSKEGIKRGCEESEWHHLNLPNCNEVHEIDLWSVLARSTATDDPTSDRVGYLNSGLWRSVWAVDPRATMQEPVVLKMMKRKHEVDARNFERHRRDALTMERMTAYPNVVDAYSFCGNSVLTEYIPVPLDMLIEKSDILTPEDSGGLDRSTPEGRTQIAIGVLKGMAALHEALDEPIVHADIQIRQFLVSSKGMIKVNDFNRCRFVGHNIKTKKPCKVGIPTAPGASRSPEEYNDQDLDEKADLYSTANVLFEVLTGKQPWRKSVEEVQRMVKKGVTPRILEKYRAPGTLDDVLANVTMAAYSFSPQDRPKASELVRILEEALNAHQRDLR